MTKAERNRQALHDLLEGHGWTLDRWGHRKNPAGTRRFKFGKRAVRLEVKSDLAGWVRIDGDFFGNITETENGLKVGMRRLKHAS